MPHHQPGRSIQQRRDPTIFCDNRRRPRCHCLRRSISEILVLRRQHKNIRISVRRPFGLALQRWGKMYMRSRSTALSPFSCSLAFIPDSSGPTNAKCAGPSGRPANAFSSKSGLFFSDMRPRNKINLSSAFIFRLLAEAPGFPAFSPELPLHSAANHDLFPASPPASKSSRSCSAVTIIAAAPRSISRPQIL